MLPKFVLLQGLKCGNRFFTSYDGTDPTRSEDGTKIYNVIGYADSVQEAQLNLYGKIYEHEK